MRNTKAFKEAVAQTLAELARRGVTVRPGTVEDVIERNMSTVAERLGIQVRSAWRYFDAAGLADSIAEGRREFEAGSEARGAGQAPMPPIDNPELALILSSVPDMLAETGGDLYAVIMNVAVNSWLAGHIHGEDGCQGCNGSRGPSGHDWPARMKVLAEHAPDITKWFDRDVWTAALHDSGFSVVRR
ncbi:hypothetical protein ACIGXI_39195 [Kitasatospora aureofaciens]|uniref:hypothetical protein n=1 Tax=Kitasatospora aureofaciens TaxID=1894 RepID=UPI0037C5A7B3